MSEYEAVIGLEVHVQLATHSKLFCACSTSFGNPPNTNVCEVCSGMPGALPAPNQQAIHFAVLAGLATRCTINRQSIFARKNYFYPDLPSGYQISQFDLPVCEHGHLDIRVDANIRKIGITRIHLENDAGKNIHVSNENASYVDLNRAGTPLIEIVSEPDMHTPAEAAAYLKTLHGLVTYLGISDGNMEEGNFRCDANISLRPKGSGKLGTRAELKNLNSFRNVQRALEFEIGRQEDILESGKEIIQETRLYDAAKNITMAMRGKEEAQDYRYFPDPDLLPVNILPEDLEKWKNELPEMPWERSVRFGKMTGLPEAEIDVLLQNKNLADFFEKASEKSDPHKIAALILGPLMRECNAGNIPPDPAFWKMTSESMAKPAGMIEKGLISSKIANDIFHDLFSMGYDPEIYVKEKGLAQISDDSALEQTIEQILQENPKEVEAYRAGKKKLMSFFVGQVMRATKGKANPAIVNKLLVKNLEEN